MMRPRLVATKGACVVDLDLHRHLRVALRPLELRLAVLERRLGVARRPTRRRERARRAAETAPT